MFANETEAKQFFRRRWIGWSETIEPSLGSGIGVPDLLVLIKVRGLMHLLPVEIKMGSVRDKRIFPVHVRPAQVRWHYKLADSGGVSALVVVVDETQAYLIEGRRVVNWKIGYPIGNTICRIFFQMESAIELPHMFDLFFKSRMK